MNSEGGLGSDQRTLVWRVQPERVPLATQHLHSLATRMALAVEDEDALGCLLLAPKLFALLTKLR